MILLLVSILLLFWVVQPEYADYADKSTVADGVKSDLEKKTSELDALNTIKTRLDDPTVRAQVDRYAGEFREDTVLASVFGARTLGVNLASVSMSPGQRLTNGLSLANISVSFTTRDLPTLTQYLSYLTAPDSDRRYVIKTLAFPYGKDHKSDISVSATLGMYYLGK